MEKQYYVQMKDVNKSFGSFQASKNINFGIEKGKLVGLLGPSGSGKTTILRMLAGLETADSGDILIDGNVVNDVPASKRGIGFVFQSYALFRYMTIYDNIAFGLKIQKWPKKRIKERVYEMLKLVGLEGLENRYPNQLSSGQRQRVAFARALAPQPSCCCSMNRLRRLTQRYAWSFAAGCVRDFFRRCDEYFRHARSGRGD